MGMIGNFLLVTDAELDALARSPATVVDVIDGAYDDRAADFVDVDKAWQCLHFLLTGTAWDGEPPLNFILAGGDCVGDEDVGYGPARGFTSHDVRAIADALDPIDAERLVRRFDAATMDALDIYPDSGRWRDADPSSSEGFAYYSQAFMALKALIQRGRTTERGLLVWLS